MTNMNDAADKAAVGALYEAMLRGWNARDGRAYAAGFAPDGQAIGFDGSRHTDRERIAADMDAIFSAHASTGRYVWIIRDVRTIGDEVAVLRADAGMIPSGQQTINPQLNATQTIVAEQVDGSWWIVLFQNTPTAFHGRPELAQQLTDELNAVAGGAA